MEVAMNKTQTKTTPEPDRLSYLWLGIATILLLFSYGMYRNLLGIFALIFVLRFQRGQKFGKGYLLLLLALIVTNIFAWWNTTYENPAIGRIIMGTIFGLLYSIGFIPDRLLVRKFHGFAATLVFPVAYTAYEFLFTWPSPMSSYNSFAYLLQSNEYLTQLASITGLWGLTFIICWFASTVNWLWEEKLVWGSIRRGVAVYGGVMLAILIFGLVRLTAFQPQPGTVNIHGVIETDYTAEYFRTSIGPMIATDPAAVKAFALPDYERYLDASLHEARAGAQIVAWPELAVVGYREDLDALLERARSLTRQENIYLAIGVGLLDPQMNPINVAENRFMIIDPKGEVVVDQLKYGCTAAFGMYSHQVQTVDTPYGRLAGVLCCDADFPYVLRQTSRKGVDILLVPAYEPTREELWVHSEMVPFRAIENGVSIFRTTIQGYSLAIDPFGRILAAMDELPATQGVFVAQLPTHRVTTIYSFIGDGAGWLAVIGLLVIIVLAILRKHKG
jgi:apolipoprotein N-acyltransferase